MRVLFSAHGGFGHVLPMVGVAKALADAGNELLFATGEALCEPVTSLGLPAVAAGLSDEIMVAEARRQWPETREQSPTSWAPRMFTEIAAPAMLTDLAPIIESFQPDLVIREEGEHAAPIAAASAEIPWVTHGWGSPLPERSTREEMAKRIAPLWTAAGLLPPPADELYGIRVLDPCPRSLYRDDSPPLPVTTVRPTALPAPATDGPSRQACRPVAYVGFGTVPLYRDQPELFESIVTALLALDFHTVVTTSDVTLSARLIALDPERVRVEQWVSLPELLAACDLVVSHGGAGTVLAALSAGVPLLLAPRGAPSQIRMSDACQARGVARTIATNPITVTDLHDALASVIRDDRFREAAGQLAREIAATPGPDQVAQLLQTPTSSGE